MIKGLNVRVGLRLFTAGLILFLFGGSAFGFVLAAVCALFPGWKYVPGVLANGLVEADKKAFLDEITKQVLTTVKEAQKENAKQSDVDKLVKELNDKVASLTNEQMKALDERLQAVAKVNEGLVADLAKSNEALNLQGLELKKIKDMAPEEKKAFVTNFKKAIRDAIVKTNTEAKEKFLEDCSDNVYGKYKSFTKFFENNKNARLSFNIDFPVEHVNKVAVDMFESNIVQPNVDTLRLTQLDPQRVGIPLTIYPHVLDVFPSKRLTRPTMALLVVYDYQDGAGTKVEGTTSVKSSFLFKTVSFKSFFIATHFVLSDETLDDLEEALDEISIVAPDKILDEIDDQILGSAGDDSSAIAGILTANKNTAFDAVPYLNTVESATIVDVIACAKRQVQKSKYKPNAVYLNPDDVMLLAAAKNSFEDSKSDRRVVFDSIGNPSMVYGLRILQSEEIVAGTCIVLDVMQTMIGRRRDMTMEIGYNGTDLVEGQKTVVLKIRLAFGVRDKAAVVYVSSISDAIININKSS